jgi:hypothetical protein
MTAFEEDSAKLANALELRYGDKDPIASSVIATTALQFARDNLGWRKIPPHHCGRCGTEWPQDQSGDCPNCTKPE